PTLSAALLLHLRPLPSPTLFPYTTLFRSDRAVFLRRRRGKRCRAPNLGGSERFSLLGPPFRKTAFENEDFGFFADFAPQPVGDIDRKSTRLNSSHVKISYAVFCLKKKNNA